LDGENTFIYYATSGAYNDEEEIKSRRYKKRYFAPDALPIGLIGRSKGSFSWLRGQERRLNS
jgi:hypothetical protein